MKHQKRLTTIAGILSLLFIASTASADEGIWHQFHKAASVGVVDLSDQKKCEFKNGRVKIKDSRDTAKVIIRYDIEFDNPSGSHEIEFMSLIARWRDNGDDARVIVKLKTYDIDTGESTTLLKLDSNDEPPEAQYRLDNVNISNPTWRWTNGDAYWLEVTLHKTGPGGKPELGMLRFIWQQG